MDADVLPPPDPTIVLRGVRRNTSGKIMFVERVLQMVVMRQAQLMGLGSVCIGDGRRGLQVPCTPTLRGEGRGGDVSPFSGLKFCWNSQI